MPSGDSNNGGEKTEILSCSRQDNEKGYLYHKDSSMPDKYWQGLKGTS